MIPCSIHFTFSEKMIRSQWLIRWNSTKIKLLPTLLSYIHSIVEKLGYPQGNRVWHISVVVKKAILKDKVTLSPHPVAISYFVKVAMAIWVSNWQGWNADIMNIASRNIERVALVRKKKWKNKVWISCLALRIESIRFLDEDKNKYEILVKILHLKFITWTINFILLFVSTV